jgi:hypothetical protein
MATIDLIPPDSAHTPGGEDTRALLYPLWVIELTIRPYPRAAPRTIRFSVDGVRGVPLPIKAAPETVTQEVPRDVRLLPAVPEAQAIETTRHFVKKGLGLLGGLVARVHVAEIRKVYKLFWVIEGRNGDALVDSRAGTVVPVPDDMPLPE